jgi:hypothetical protein
MEQEKLKGGQKKNLRNHMEGSTQNQMNKTQNINKLATELATVVNR